jgi:hypothetical protein
MKLATASCASSAHTTQPIGLEPLSQTDSDANPPGSDHRPQLMHGRVTSEPTIETAAPPLKGHVTRRRQTTALGHKQS